MNMTHALSWGRYPVLDQSLYPLRWQTDPWPALTEKQTLLPYGQGRSYGDVCQNEHGILLSSQEMDWNTMRNVKIVSRLNVN